MSGWTPENILQLLTLIGVIITGITGLITVIKSRENSTKIDAQTATSKQNAEATQAAVHETTKEVQRNTGITVMAADAIDANTQLTASTAQHLAELKGAVVQAIGDSGPRPAVLPQGKS